MQCILVFFYSMTELVDMQISEPFRQIFSVEVPVYLENHFVYQILKRNIFPVYLKV